VSEQARPWWASEGPVEGGISPDEDPVERFRSARRGSPRTAASGPDAEPWLEAAAATMSRLARDLARGTSGDAPPDDSDRGADGADPAASGTSRGGARRDGTSEQTPPPHSPDVCGVCPICVGLRTLAEARPELMGHLAEAARHVALAARSLTERPEKEHGDDGDEPLERIDLD
jgi:hypothetical protein